MARKIVIAIVLTLAILVFAKRASMNKPEDAGIAAAGVTLKHTTLFEHVGEGFPRATLEMEPFSGNSPEIVYRIAHRNYDPDMNEVRVAMSRDGSGTWEGYLPEMKKGARIEYAFEVLSGEERLRLPGDPQEYFLLKYKGEVSNLVLVLHIVFMFAAFFFVILTALCALDILRGRADAAKAAALLRWVLLFTFIGGWPLGFILNRQRFGYLWEGYPFGYDITDNKTQIMFIFWIVTAVLARGSVFGGGEEKNSVGRKGFAAAALVSFAVSLAIFLIPHSL